MKTKFQKFVTFNCKGLIDEIKKMHITDDTYKFRPAAIMLWETHCKGTESDGKKSFFLY